MTAIADIDFHNVIVAGVPLTPAATARENNKLPKFFPKNTTDKEPVDCAFFLKPEIWSMTGVE